MMENRWHWIADKPKGGEKKHCPVQCGVCCANGSDVTCSQLGLEGCLLKDCDRPVICNEYLCEAAKKVLVLLKANREALEVCRRQHDISICSNCDEFIPCTWAYLEEK